MPRYDFRCPKCKNCVELQRSLLDEVLPLCCNDGCDGKISMEQIISAPAFYLKGSGWAADGYSKAGVG